MHDDSPIRVGMISMEAYAMLRPGLGRAAGGAGQQLVQLARGLRRRGHHVTFVAEDQGQLAREDIEGFEVLRAGRITFDRRWPRVLGNVGRLQRAMAASNADVFVVRGSRYLVPQCLAFARLLRTPLMVMAASDNDCRPEARENLPRLYNDLYGQAMRRVEVVTAQTRDQQVLLHRHFGREAPLVTNGIATPTVLRAAPLYDVLWAGTINPWKNPRQIIRISELCPDLRFAVAGGPGNDRSYHDQTVAALADRPNVTLLGHVPPDRMGEFFSRARMLLNTSEFEGFPNTFLQAWVRGLPTASLHADPDGVITRHGLGMVEPDHEKLAQGITAMLQDQVSLEEIAGRCRQYVAAHHDLDAVVHRFIEILDSMIPHQQARGLS